MKAHLRKRIIKTLMTFTLAFVLVISNLASVKAIGEQRTPDSFAPLSYVIGTHEFNSNIALTIERIMLAARTITGEELEEGDMVIYYKNSRGNWINASTGDPIPSKDLPKSFTITHTNLVGSDPEVDRTALKNAIVAAKNNLESVETSGDGKDVDPLQQWVTEETKNDYQAAIAAAEAVLIKNDITSNELNEELVKLTQAMLNFDSAKKDGIVIVSAISVEPKELTLKVGETGNITATVEPDNAANKNVTWSSSNEDIATVDENGNVTAVAAGTVTITATTVDGGFAGSVQVVIGNVINLTKNKGYETIQEAVEEVEDDNTLKLIADTSTDTGISIDRNIIFDLNGMTITSNWNANEEGNENAIAIVVKSIATIKNGTIITNNGTGGIQADGTSANLTIDGLTINQNGLNTKKIYNSTAVLAANEAKVTIISGDYTAETDAVLVKANGGTVIIEDGTFTAGRSAARNDAWGESTHSLTINGGIFEAEKEKDSYALFSAGGNAETTVNGGIFNGEINSEYNHMIINDGTFNQTIFQGGGHQDYYIIYGGTFVDDLSGTLPKNTRLIRAINTTNDKGYETIQEAIDEASKGDTIKLNADIEFKTNGLTIGTDREITLDLAGYVMSGVLDNVGASALIANNGSLTIKDSSIAKTGKITNQAENPDKEWEAGFPAYANNTITNSGKLIINGGHIENTTGGKGASYVIDNNSGPREAVVIINGGYIVNPNGNFAIRQFANSTENKNSVTINGGIVEGTRAVWIQLPGSSGQEKLAELTVNGGTLKSTDEVYNHAVYSYTFGDSFAKTKITINGGTFDGDVALTGGNPKNPMETVKVSDEAIFLGQRGVFTYAKIVNVTKYKSYDTIQAAIDAAEDGDTIQIAAGTYDESIVVPEEKVRSITILGADSATIPTSSDVDGTIITGGMTFGRDISTNPTIEKSITVKGITFSGGSGLIFKDIRNVTVENNKFIGITAGDAAVTVLDPSPNDRNGVTTISNNYIVGVSGLGIYVRRPAPTTVIESNHVENTDHNSIQVVGVSAGPDVTITDNTLINWDQNKDTDGGRAIRINFDPVDASTALAVTGNTFIPNDDADPVDPDYVKITGVSTDDDNVNNLISSLINKNTWPSGTNYGTVILVNTTAGTSN